MRLGEAPLQQPGGRRKMNQAAAAIMPETAAEAPTSGNG